MTDADKFSAAANKLAGTFDAGESAAFMLDIFKATCVVADALDNGNTYDLLDDLSDSISDKTMEYIKELKYNGGRDVGAATRFIKAVLTDAASLLPVNDDANTLYQFNALKNKIAAYISKSTSGAGEESAPIVDRSRRTRKARPISDTPIYNSEASAIKINNGARRPDVAHTRRIRVHNNPPPPPPAENVDDSGVGSSADSQTKNTAPLTFDNIGLNPLSKLFSSISKPKSVDNAAVEADIPPPPPAAGVDNSGADGSVDAQKHEYVPSAASFIGLSPTNRSVLPSNGESADAGRFPPQPVQKRPGNLHRLQSIVGLPPETKVTPTKKERKEQSNFNSNLSSRIDHPSLPNAVRSAREFTQDRAIQAIDNQSRPPANVFKFGK